MTTPAAPSEAPSAASGAAPGPAVESTSPPFAAAAPPEGGPAELLACEVDGDRLAVTARRALGGWPLDGSRPAVWAMGPVSEGSNATAPVPLYHLLRLPGAAAPRAVNAPTGSDLTVALGAPPAPGGACAPLAGGGGGGGAPPPAPVAATIGAAPGNVFEFTIGWVGGWAAVERVLFIITWKLGPLQLLTFHFFCPHARAPAGPTPTTPTL